MDFKGTTNFTYAYMSMDGDGSESAVSDLMNQERELLPSISPKA